MVCCLLTGFPCACGFALSLPARAVLLPMLCWLCWRISPSYYTGYVNRNAHWGRRGRTQLLLCAALAAVCWDCGFELQQPYGACIAHHHCCCCCCWQPAVALGMVACLLCIRRLLGKVIRLLGLVCVHSTCRTSPIELRRQLCAVCCVSWCHRLLLYMSMHLRSLVPHSMSVAALLGAEPPFCAAGWIGGAGFCLLSGVSRCC